MENDKQGTQIKESMMKKKISIFSLLILGIGLIAVLYMYLQSSTLELDGPKLKPGEIKVSKPDQQLAAVSETAVPEAEGVVIQAPYQQMQQNIPPVTEAAERPVPPDAEAYYKQGTEFYYQGKYDLAIEAFQKAVDLNPEYAAAYCEMGVSYMEKSDWQTAIEKLAKCIEIDPRYPKGQYAIAVSYARKKNPDVVSARRHFEISKSLGFVYPEWFEGFLTRLEAGERFPGQE